MRFTRHVLYLMVLLNSACVAALYDGPPRPDSDVATVVPTEVIVVRIDEREAPTDSSLKILPGRHSLVALLHDGVYFSHEPLAVCFTAERGRTYQVRVSLSPRRWAIKMVDADTDRPIVTRETHPYLPDCSAKPAPPPVRPVPRLVLKTPGLLANTEVSETETTSSHPADAREGPAVSEEATPVVTSTAPPAQAEPAVPQIQDGEEPPSSRRPERQGPLRPGSGLGFELGGAFGGARLATVTLNDGTTENIDAGTGLVSSVTGSWMPLWLTNAVGFGGAVSVGIKYSTIGADNGAIKLSRFPVSVAVQSLLGFNRNWYFLARAGALKELRIHLRGDGVASEVDVTMNSSGGRLVEAGLYYAPDSSGALACTVRRTWLLYKVAGRSLDANSVTIAASLHLNF